MSIKVMSLVWDHVDLSGNALLTLLALADFAGDEGDHCFPSIPRIANKIGCQDRSVYRILQDLRDHGYITIASGGGSGVTNCYQIEIDFIVSLPSKNPDKKTLKKKQRNLFTEIYDTKTLTKTHKNPDKNDNAIRKNRHITTNRTVTRKKTSANAWTDAERDQIKRLHKTV